MNPTLTPISSLTANSTPSTGFSTTPTQTVSQPPAIPAPVVAPKAPTVVTSTPARNETQAMVDYLASQFTYEQKQAIERQQRADAQKALDAQKKSPLYQTVSALADVNLNAKGATVTPQEGMSAAEQARLQRDADMAAVSAELSRIQASMDARTATTIENIKQEYAQLDAEQRMANKAYEAGVTTAGFVSGRSQYAQEIQMGIVKAAVDDGINKLSKIQAKKAQLINEAEAARDERNYKLLSAKMDALRENAKDERDFALKLEQNVREAAREERNAVKENLANESRIGEILAASVIGSLTGNATTDNAMIQSVATAQGISPLVLRSSIDAYKAQQAKDAKASLPAKALEYEYYKSQGGKKTPDQYFAPTGNGGGGKVLTKDDVEFYGLSPSMVGQSETAFRASLSSQVAPQWFANQTKVVQPSATSGQIQSLWNAFRVKQASPIDSDAYGG